MIKKDIKENIKKLEEIAEENRVQTKTLDILNSKNESAVLADTFSVVQSEAAVDLKWSAKPTLPSQEIIKKNVNKYTSEKAFNLVLENGPFCATHTVNGSNMLFYNSSGYIASYSTQSLKPGCELSLQEPIYSAKWLHNEKYFATAQREGVFVYDFNGSELHAVRQITEPKHLEFLPHHFLLATAGENAKLRYLDTSIGKVVADIFVKDRGVTMMSQNPSNAIIHLGTKSGNVTLWSPAQQEYLMKIHCHSTALTGIQIDRSGNKMITSALDGKLKIFDVRNTFAPLKIIKCKGNIQHSALSQSNMYALSSANTVVVLKNFEELYMKHKVGNTVSSLEFCPFADILAVGHSGGISNIIVPGSTDGVYDSSEMSPFMSTKQKQELEVKKLMEKIPYELISQESILGKMHSVSKRSGLANPVERYYNANNESNSALSRFRKY
ncbi:U3 small nucleolar RNA-associated protein 7 [Enteropsectra breve]|nr:U3 small nucleolar RNA-associated protein 7 [Enteropsectra breve]